MERAEIEDIAKLAAQDTLRHINRYTQEYKEPETEAIGLSESISEENTAADWYRRRASIASKKTAEIYEHIAKEEETHASEFSKCLDEVRVKSGMEPSTPSEPKIIQPLTPRELEILQLLAKGLTNKKIADKLHLAVSTVKNTVVKIMGKMGADSRTEAAVTGIQQGLVTGEPARRAIPLSEEQLRSFKEFLETTLGRSFSDSEAGGAAENMRRCFAECVELDSTVFPVKQEQGQEFFIWVQYDNEKPEQVEDEFAVAKWLVNKVIAHPTEEIVRGAFEKVVYYTTMTGDDEITLRTKDGVAKIRIYIGDKDGQFIDKDSEITKKAAFHMHRELDLSDYLPKAPALR